MDKKVIVISGINIISGGPMTILKDCLASLNKLPYIGSLKIYVLVNKNIFPEYSNFTFLEFPLSKKRWIYRLYYEYIYFRTLSKKLKPNLWFSLHDITPTVNASKRMVYMHNPSPFNKVSIKDFFESPVYGLFALFYKYLYQINIKKNDYLIVQQNWLRTSFSKMFQIDQSKIIVAYPILKNSSSLLLSSSNTNKFTFFYPTFPRPFKNIEVICRAVEILERENMKPFEVVITIKGNENKYSRNILRRYGYLKNIRFIGLQSLEEVNLLYASTDCLIFPSKLETWGLPISEFAPYKKPILVADLPYAHETSVGTSLTAFFNPDAPEELATKMKNVINQSFSDLKEIKKEDIHYPFVMGWEDLFDFIFSDNTLIR